MTMKELVNENILEGKWNQIKGKIKQQWGDTPTFPAIATRGEGVLETFRELMRQLYRGLEDRHDFSAKFSLSEDEFLKGVMKNFR